MNTRSLLKADPNLKQDHACHAKEWFTHLKKQSLLKKPTFMHSEMTALCLKDQWKWR